MGEIEHRLVVIEANVNRILVMLNRWELRMSQEIDDLTAAVAQESTVTASAVAAFQSLATMIANAATDPAAVEALAQEVAANATKLAAAIPAGTVAAPIASTPASPAATAAVAAVPGATPTPASSVPGT